MYGYCVLENESNGNDNGLRPRTRSFGVLMISVTIQHQILCASNSSLGTRYPSFGYSPPRPFHNCNPPFEFLHNNQYINIIYPLHCVHHRASTGIIFKLNSLIVLKYPTIDGREDFTEDPSLIDVLCNIITLTLIIFAFVR